MRPGHDRRQPMLREQQIIDLYGEENIRLIQHNSVDMPIPVPLAFGCGYFARGEWSPYAHEPNYWDPFASLQATVAARPFAGHDDLGSLTAAIAELDQRRVAPIAGAGFASVDDLVSEATIGGKSQQLYYQKASFTTAAGAAYQMWMQTGMPGAGAIPAAGLASTAPTSATAGALGLNDAAVGDTQHWISGQAIASVVGGALLFHDMTLQVQPILATLTQQTITGSPTRYQSNGQNGVLPFCFMGAAANATTPTITITYTESITGATGHTTGGIVSQASATAFRTNRADGSMFYPLASGDLGVRRIETTQQSTTFSTSAVMYGLAKPYFWAPFADVANVMGQFVDLLNLPFGLPQIQTAACVSAFLAAAQTTSGLIQCFLTCASG